MTTRLAALVAIILLFLPAHGRAAETLSDADRAAIRQVIQSQLDAFKRYSRAQGTPDNASGWVSSEFAMEDKDPSRIVGIIRFKDKESYVKNANAPQTNDSYNEMLKFLEGPPEWIDVTYVAFQGEPLKEYLMRVRIEIVKHLLIETDQSLGVIAEMVGLCDAGHLCRLFARYVGGTPGKFRRAAS